MVALNFDRARPRSSSTSTRSPSLRLVARERDAQARRRTHVRGGAERRARRGVARACRGVAHGRLAQIWNRGTIGGNLGTASPGRRCTRRSSWENAEVELASVRPAPTRSATSSSAKRNALEPG